MTTTVALVAHDVHDGGGMERVFHELVRGAAADVRFVVVAATLAPDLRERVEWLRVPAPRRPMPLKMLVFAAIAGLRLRRVSADLVHTLGAIVPNRADVATVQYCHAAHVELTGRLAPPEMPPLRRLNTALMRLIALAGERWCYRPARLRVFAAVSSGVAGELARHYGELPVAITPNGVDSERFRPDAAARAATRGAEGVDDDTFVALFVGGDWDRKGLGVALDAFALARRGGVGRARLWVVGTGDTTRFRIRAEKAGIGDSVSFFGPRSDTERYFQAADLFVLPTEYETFSLVAYEAAAAGLPVVATRMSGIEELLAGGEAGILCPRDPGAFAAAIVRLAAEPELRARMGDAGRGRAKDYTWERSVGSVLALYRSLGDS